MKKRNFLTLEQHLQTADDLAVIQALFKQIDAKFVEFYNKSHPVAKKIRKFVANDGYISQLQSDLDNEFHKFIDEKTWKELNSSEQGHIYYNLHKRLISDAKLNSGGEKAWKIRKGVVSTVIKGEGGNYVVKRN